MARVDPIIVTLEDGRPCVIRSAEPSDARAYDRHSFEMRGTSDHLVITPDEPRRAIYDVRAMIERDLAAPTRLGLIAHPPLEPDAPSEPEIIGSLEFHGHEQRRLAHVGQFGVSVSTPFRGLGVGRALITRLLDWGAAHETIEKVALGVMAGNARARKLYRSMGFVDECRRLRFFKLDDGDYDDDVQMAIYVKPGSEAPGFNVWTSRATAPHTQTAPGRETP